MIKVTYREHKGRVFRIKRTIRERIRLPSEDVAGYRPNYAELKQWSRRQVCVTYSIRTGDSWRYCFANVARKDVKKWLDYFVARY